MQQLRNDRSASSPERLSPSASPSFPVAVADLIDSSNTKNPRRIPPPLAVSAVPSSGPATPAFISAAAVARHSTPTPTPSPLTSFFAFERSQNQVATWKHDHSQSVSALYAPASIPTTISATAASVTSAILQPGLYTAISPRGLQAANRGLAQPPIPAKRPPSSIRGENIMHPSPVKKARTGASPPRRVEIPTVAAGLQMSARAQAEGPISPLFFSHTPSRHVTRPATVPTAEITSSMLGRLREDTAGSVTTLKLPRASVSAVNAARSESTPGSLASSMDVPANSSSPDSRFLPPGLQMLQGVGVIEFLEQDERPTFLIDLDNSANASRAGLHILYYNASLRAAHDILQCLSVDQEDASPDTDFGRFKSWIMRPSKSRRSPDPSQASHIYGGITWTVSTLRKRFRFVSGTGNFVSARPSSPMPLSDEAGMPNEQDRPRTPEIPVIPDAEIVDAPDYFGEAGAFNSIVGVTDQDDSRLHPDDFTNQVYQSQPAKSIFDWTRIPITENLPEHIKFARSIDWAATPLGPIEDWPADLRAMSNLVMGSPHPAAMYWGPQFVAIYNAAYVDMAGRKHPQLMGACYQDAWPEIWDEIKPVFKNALEAGQATMKHENQLIIDRNGFLEECFFSWSVVPMVGGDGEVVGLYNPAFEDTRRRVNERRMLMLREIGERTAAATSVNDFWPQVQKGLEESERDVPFALIYSVRDETESDVSSLHSGKKRALSRRITRVERSRVLISMASRLWASRVASHLRISVFHRGFASVVKDLKYADSHEWVKINGNSATIGITDHAQDHLGDVVYVELPEVGATVTRGSSFGAVESVKATSDINSPVSGEVVEVNEELSSSPGLVNASPYENGWIIKVEMSNAGDVNSLMDSDQYSKFCEDEDAKH